MANNCFTKLSIQKTDNTKKEISEMSDEMIKDINENISYQGDASQDWCDEDLMEVSTDTRWNIPTEELSAFCKKYNVKVRAVGEEPGCGFVQVVCIEDTGEVIQDEAISFSF